MKLLIVTALFPPDIAAPAPFVKELVSRVASEYHTTVLTYGNIPEAVTNVKIITTPKSISAPGRLWHFTRSLIALAKKADVVIIQNAPSTELPLIIASFFTKPRWLLMNSDTKIIYTGWRKYLHTLACTRAIKINITQPLPRPEILPFVPKDQKLWTNYAQSWSEYIPKLKKYFS